MLESLTKAWLALQCEMVPGTSRGLLLLGESGSGPYKRFACWPEGSTDSRLLNKVAQAAVRKRRPVIIRGRDTSIESAGFKDVVALPVFLDSYLRGVVAIERVHEAKPQQRAVLWMLQWGAAWFARLAGQVSSVSSTDLGMVLETIATTLAEDRARQAATAAVTELATRLRCERVSIGFLRGKSVQIGALSHSATFEEKQDLIRQIEVAMDEALDREATVIYPTLSGQDAWVCHAHAELARHQGSTDICTVPLCSNNQMIGAMTFERGPAEGAFNAETVELCEQIGALVGPVLELRRREERSLASKACDSCRRQLSRLFGTGHLTLKAGATALVGLTIFFCLVTGQYQIAADASLEGAIERVVVAPQEGFIVTATARPGDVVKKGDVLAGLDDRDLKLERLKWSSQRQQLTKEHREALAKHDRAAISILGARLAQADAQIELLEKQLDRTQVEAPFDGVIVEGDLKRALGSPVERGQILYKVAPLDDYRIVLEVDEREISEVKVGHHGQVTLAAAPGEPLAFVVQRVTPVSNAEEGNNFFQVEAQLQERLNFLRPGMQGVGKIEIGQRKLIWIWTHKMLDWIRLWLWSWWP